MPPKPKPKQRRRQRRPAVAQPTDTGNLVRSVAMQNTAMRTIAGGERVERGRLALGSITERDTLSAEKFEVSILSLSESRLGRLMELYDYWQVRSLRFTYITALTVIEPGMARFYFETDPIQEATGDITAFMSNAGAVANTAHENCTFDAPFTAKQRAKVRHTAVSLDEPRSWNLGYVASFCSGTTKSVNNEIGTLYMDYDVVFRVPSIRTSPLKSFVADAIYNATGVTMDAVASEGTLEDMAPALCSAGTTPAGFSIDEVITCVLPKETSYAECASTPNGILQKGTRLFLWCAKWWYETAVNMHVTMTGTSTLGIVKTSGGRTVVWHIPTVTGIEVADVHNVYAS